jgi:hypothetical protein
MFKIKKKIEFFISLIHKYGERENQCQAAMLYNNGNSVTFFKQFKTTGDFYEFMKRNAKTIFKELSSADEALRAQFSKYYTEFKKTMHPMNHPENRENLKGLKAAFDAHNGCEECDTAMKKELGGQISDFFRKVDASPETKEHSRIFGKSDILLAKIIEQDNKYKKGKSNRAKKAKNSRLLFRNAEQLSMATPDSHGNTASNGGDLGQDGAFEGLIISIIKQYSGLASGQYEPWVRDLCAKGFTVNVYSYLTTQELTEVLETSNQVWLISDCRGHLSDEHINMIDAKWRQGLPLYIFGDNDPFFVDANKLLAKMELPEMSGNYVGSNYVYPSIEGGAKGIEKTLPTTGITGKLFEGITIAEMSPARVKETGCTVVMYNSRGGISVIMREAQDGCGQVIIDGAFTKLWCKYDAAGSKFLVINSACYLGADFSEPVEEDEKEPQPEEKTYELNFEDCFQGECDITYVEGPVSFMFATMEQTDKFTNDYTLDDPLGISGDVAKMLPPHQYASDIASMFMHNEEDPFTRLPVFSTIPAVSLKLEGNRRIVQKLLCDTLMCGLSLNSAVWLLFLGACDYILGNKPDHPETYAFFINEIINHIYSTPDFSNNFTTFEDKVPLIQAFQMYSRMDEMKRNRKSFQTTCIMARIIENFSDDKENTPNLVKWCRQSFIKMIVWKVMTFAKAKSGDVKTKKWFDETMSKDMFDHYHNIPTRGSNKEISSSHVIKEFFDDKIKEVHDRIIGDFGIECLLDDNQTTALIMILLFTKDKIIRMYQIETFITELLKSECFQSLWNGEHANYYPIMDAKFSKYKVVDDKHSQGVPFATLMGPSVFVCSCGAHFGDPKRKITPEYADVVKEKRNRHFENVYGSALMGYVTHTSGHYNVHRAIQTVMSNPEHSADKSVDEKHIKGICEYLIKDNKTRGGDIFDKHLMDVIDIALRSYLKCRNKGMQQPTQIEGMRFIDKMRHEQTVCYGI